MFSSHTVRVCRAGRTRAHGAYISHCLVSLCVAHPLHLLHHLFKFVHTVPPSSGSPAVVVPGTVIPDRTVKVNDLAEVPGVQLLDDKLLVLQYLQSVAHGMR